MIADIWKGARATGQPRAARAGETKRSVNDAIAVIVKLIPMEVIALHTALVGLFGQSWIIFGAGAVAIIALFLLSWAEERQQAGEGSEAPGGLPVAAILFAFIAYIPCAASLPETPFLELHENANQIAAGVAIVMSVFIERVARLFGVEV